MDLMSTTQLMGNVGEFVGAIGVVVTLGYLVIQIRQNNRMLKFEPLWFLGPNGYYHSGYAR